VTQHQKKEKTESSSKSFHAEYKFWNGELHCVTQNIWLPRYWAACKQCWKAKQVMVSLQKTLIKATVEARI